MASFAERMAAHKAASNSTPAAPVVATQPTAVPVVATHDLTAVVATHDLTAVVATHDLAAVVATHDLTAVGINPPSGVPEGAPVLLGEFDPDRQSKGPFYQNDDGEWVQLKGLKKPELKDAVKVLAARVRDAGLTATFEHNLTATTLDMKQIAADAKINVEGLRQTAALLIRTLARDNEDELRRAGVDALPTSVPEHRLTAVRIERAGGSRAEALVNLLKDGRSEEFVRLVNVSFEAPMSEDLLARTIAVVPTPKALPLPVPDVHIAVGPEAIDAIIDAIVADEPTPDAGETDYNALKQNDPPEGIKALMQQMAEGGDLTEVEGLLFRHTEIKPEHYLREEGSAYVRLVKPDVSVHELTYHLQDVNDKYNESLVPCELVEDIAKGILYPNHKAETPAAVVGAEPAVVAEPDATPFAERIKTLTSAARWAKHEKKDVMAHLVEVNAKLNPPVAENALRSVEADVCGVTVQNNVKADAAFQFVRDLKAQVEVPSQAIATAESEQRGALVPCTSHGATAPIIAVGCEIAGPLLMQDFEAILTSEFEPKIAKKTGAQYGQAAYSEDYKLMAGLVEHYGKKQFDQHKNGVMTLNSFRRDRQYILDGLARAGWIILNGRG